MELLYDHFGATESQKEFYRRQSFAGALIDRLLSPPKEHGTEECGEVCPDCGHSRKLTAIQTAAGLNEGCPSCSAKEGE